MNEEHPLSRTRLLLKDQGMQRLSDAKVVVLGLGGVGGSCAEALVRSGVGHLVLVDHDVVSPSNLNRQVIATWDTVGQRKTEAALARFSSLSKTCRLEAHDVFLLGETIPQAIPLDADYVIDCIDTVTAKLEVAVFCETHNIPLISSMGAGNKLDPSQFVFCDIYETTVCPLAKVMRRELRKRGVASLEVLYSLEPARTPWKEAIQEQEEVQGRRTPPGSVAFVPPVAGLYLAGFVVRRLLGV
ncbi:CsdL protein of the HesA/MoeB/ThiF family, part of the CsdA-E-L sulfur transfer pathway [Clostridiaceae bacterium JG1575]|nr:CsdL protein of the HesA/MoeB/ThiF family, part of the CsdA-E-L sulfur transfer pathway [Clostridiaceae bacterium JG1575]